MLVKCDIDDFIKVELREIKMNIDIKYCYPITIQNKKCFGKDQNPSSVVRTHHPGFCLHGYCVRLADRRDYLTYTQVEA
jgi:hypothetical protein